MPVPTGRKLGLIKVLTVAGLLSFCTVRSAVSTPNADAAKTENTITITGRVFVEGKSVPQATVFLREAPASWSQTDAGWRPSATRNIAQTTTDADGHFGFRNVELPEATLTRQHALPLDIVAQSPGRGLAWRHIAALPRTPLDLSLPEERKVAGRLIERDGRPVAGVRVRVREIADLSQPARPSLESPDYLDLESSDVPLAAVTNADGRFVLRGLPGDIRATLVVDDPRYLRRQTYLATTDEPPGDLLTWPAGPPDLQPIAVPVRPWYAQIEVEPAYRLLGKVVFADTGQPANGAGFNDPQTFSPPVGFTDSDGGFTLEGLAPGQFRLHITAPPESGYLGVDATVDLSGETHEVEETLKLPRGELVRGRVVDANTGHGLGGATIWPIAKSDARRNPQPFAEKILSAADGRFAIVVTADATELIVTGPIRGYVTHDRSGSVTLAPAEFHRPIDVRRGQHHAEVTFELRPKLSTVLAAHVVDGDGKPAGGAEIQYQGFGRGNASGTRPRPARTVSDADGGFVLENLDPSLEYELRVIDRRRGLGDFLRLARLDQWKTPLTLALKPLAAAEGRIVDEKHQPIVGAAVRLYAWQGQFGSLDGEPVASDSSGRFAFTQLLPGLAYQLQTSADGFALRRDDQFTLAVGEQRALGDIVLPRADQELTGVLVDVDGQPVAGASVVAQSDLAEPRYHARTETRVTDRQGRFHLRGLSPGGAIIWQSFDPFGNRKAKLGDVTAGSKDLRFVVGRPSVVK